MAVPGDGGASYPARQEHPRTGRSTRKRRIGSHPPLDRRAVAIERRLLTTSGVSLGETATTAGTFGEEPHAHSGSTSRRSRPHPTTRSRRPVLRGPSPARRLCRQAGSRGDARHFPALVPGQRRTGRAYVPDSAAPVADADRIRIESVLFAHSVCLTVARSVTRFSQDAPAPGRHERRAFGGAVPAASAAGPCQNASNPPFVARGSS